MAPSTKPKKLAATNSKAKSPKAPVNKFPDIPLKPPPYEHKPIGAFFAKRTFDEASVASSTTCPGSVSTDCPRPARARLTPPKSWTTPSAPSPGNESVAAAQVDAPSLAEQLGEDTTSLEGDTQRQEMIQDKLNSGIDHVEGVQGAPMKGDVEQKPSFDKPGDREALEAMDEGTQGSEWWPDPTGDVALLGQPPSPPSAAPNVDDLKSRMEGICANKINEYMETHIGKPLTEENVAEFQKWLGDRAATKSQEEEFGASSLNGFEKKEHERLDTALRIGVIETKSYLGNQFRKHIEKSPEDKIAFGKCMNRQEQAKFRMEWANKKHQEFKESKTKSQCWKRVDSSTGQYMNFARMVQHLGGWRSQEAVRGASTCANKCLAMGRPWHQKHPQTDLVEFLLMDYKWTETFEQSWATFQESYSRGTLESPMPDEKTKGEESGAKRTAGKKVVKDEAKGKGTKRDRQGKASKDIDEMDLSTLWKEGGKLKVAFQKTSCTYLELDEKIRSHAAWELAKGVKHDELARAHKEVKNSFSEWHREFVMSSDLNSFKRAHSSAKAQAELCAFLNVVEGTVALLTRLCEKLQRAHIEMNKEA